MKKLIASTAVVLLAAGAAYANDYTPAAPTIGAQVGSSSSGIGNNATTVYHGASITDSENSAINSASNTQAGFLNTFAAGQAGSSAEVNTGDLHVSDPLVKTTVGAGGTINMHGMFQLLNTTNSIGG